MTRIAVWQYNILYSLYDFEICKMQNQIYQKIVDNKQLFAALDKPISLAKRRETVDIRGIGMNGLGRSLSSVLGGTILVRKIWQNYYKRN